MTTVAEKWINRGSMTLLAVAAMLFALVAWQEITKKLEHPPVEWFGVSVLTPSIEVGGELVLEYDARVNKQCPAELRSFLREIDGSVVARWITSGGYTPARDGRRKIRVRLRIDNDATGQFPQIKPGRHTYEVTAIRFCDDGMKVDNLIPKATFEIRR